MEENEVNCPLCNEELGDFCDLAYHLAVTHSHKILKFVKVKKTKDKQIYEFWIEDDPFDLDFPNFDDINDEDSFSRPILLTKNFHYNLMLSKIQRIFCQMDLTNKMFLPLEKLFSDIPSYKESRSAKLGVEINDSIIESIQAVHVKPHGLKHNKESNLDYMMESEDDEEYLYDFKANFLNQVAKLKEIGVVETLVLLKFKQIYRQAKVISKEFEQSFSMSKVLPNFFTKLVPIIMNELIDSIGYMKEFQPEIKGLLIALSINNQIDINTFNRLLIDLEELENVLNVG